MKNHRPIGSEIEEAITQVLAEDLGISKREIHLTDDLRTTLGYSVDPLAAEDQFCDLAILFESYGVTLSELETCSSVFDLVKLVEKKKGATQ